MPFVKFFSEEIDFKLKKQRNTAAWIRLVIQQEGGSLGDISFIFCSDTYLHDINVEYLSHNTLTDIITFDNSEEAGVIQGDIFISIDRVKDNSLKFKTDFDDEIHRVIIHGILHLIGYGDKSKAAKKQMRGKEDAYLSLR